LENAGLGIYTLISKWGFPKTYRGKIMLVSFLGTHAPVLGTALYLLLGASVGLGAALRILTLLVAVTLVGTAATLLALGALLAPVRLISSALKRYLDDRTKPDPPIGSSDEAGRLMAHVRYAVEHLDSSIRSLEGLSGTDHLIGLPNRRDGEGGWPTTSRGLGEAELRAVSRTGPAYFLRLLSSLLHSMPPQRKALPLPWLLQISFDPRIGSTRTPFPKGSK